MPLARAWGGVAERRPLTRRELLAAALLLLLAGAALFGSHVVDGNFSYDDWALGSLVKYTGYWSVVDFYLHIDHRPLIALYLPLVQLLGGEHAHVELAWIAFARVTLTFSLYVFLRTVVLERVGAGAIALLVLLFPFADAGWMYVIGSPGSIAVSLYLLGATAALRGLDAAGRRRAALHALAVALYVASVLLYELALIAICLTGALYLLRSPPRVALRRWAVDIGAIVITVLLVTSRAVPLLPGKDVHEILTLSQQMTHAKLIYQQGRYVLAASLQPFGAVYYFRVLGVAGLVMIAALVLQARLGPSEPARRELRRWLLVAAGAFTGLASAWLLLVPSDPYYSPRAAGVGNRINAFAAVCICVLAFALAMLLATLVARALRRSGGWAMAGALALTALIAVGYARRVDTDKSDWARASRLQKTELALLHRAVPHPSRGTEIVLFGAPAYTAPGVPVFAAPWDLNGAVQLSWHDYSLTAYPAIAGGLPTCGSARVVPPGGGYTLQQLSVGYGKTLFVNGRSGAVLRIGNRIQCQAALARFPAGPLLLG